MGYRTVLLDLDHTLLDSDASLAAAYDLTMRSIGVDDPDAVFATFDRINEALWRRVERHEIGPDDVKVMRFRSMLDELALDGDPVEMGATFAQGLADHGELYDGALGLLDDIAGRSTLALVTNGIGAVQRGRIERLGLGAYFETVTISAEVGTSKPGAKIFDLAFDALGNPARSDAVMIGDSLPSDIAGGTAANIDTIWFNPSSKTNDTDLVPTHQVTTLADISPLI